MKSAIRSILTACLVCLGAGSMHAQTSLVPQGMSYQGFLTDESGNPVANAAPENQNVEFRVYAQATGGTALWGEAQTVTVLKGNFSVVLGNGSALSGIPSGQESFANLFTAANSDNRFFGITPQGGAEFSPRQRILSSAYALRSRVAESVVQTSGFSVFPEVRTTGAIKITGSGQQNFLEFGSDVSGKAPFAGTISYQGQTDGLDINGAGNTNESRKITMWAEGGTTFKGPISFGAESAQLINLFNNEIGIGVQDNTLYQRSPNNFAWHRGGTHHDGTNNPGGGTCLATLNTSGFDLKAGSFTGNGSGLTNLPPATAANNFTVTGIQNFGSRLGQHINLYADNYGFGIQDNTLYSRAGHTGRFSWYIGGTHSDTENQPGTNGTMITNWNALRLEINRPILSVSTGSAGHNFGIKTNGSMVAAAFTQSSDDRIKNVIRASDGAADIETLRALQVTDYTMKDQSPGDEQTQHKMLIAQQVEEVYPQAVIHQTGELPDILRDATVKDAVVLLADHEEIGLTAGDTLRLVQGDATVLARVTHLTPEGFAIDEPLADGGVFVYGRQVEDLRTVEYDAIAMLNVSATQELLRRLEAQQQLIERLQQEKSEMSKEVTHLRAASAQQDARLTRLESLIPTVEGASGSFPTVGGASGSPSPVEGASGSFPPSPVTTLAR